MPTNWIFLGHDELTNIRKLRNTGRLDEAEHALLVGEPSPAVLDELRKIASTRAKLAKKIGDWKAVIKHLEGYIEYSNKWRSYCIKMVNQEPPSHTEQDMKLLKQAKSETS